MTDAGKKSAWSTDQSFHIKPDKREFLNESCLHNQLLTVFSDKDLVYNFSLYLYEPAFLIQEGKHKIIGLD